ncbi:ferric reductase NAD binding domain-containing protein [Xylaria sp. CBS 124048]|nr:ferric reductase NAD binding domain-containing protein [Xylaria sp. CBS 124048]
MESLPVGAPGSSAPFEFHILKSSKGKGHSQQHTEEQVLTYYAASLSALIAIFILDHWTRRLTSGLSRFKIFYPITALSRLIRRSFLRPFPGFPSTGHAVLVTLYVVLNALFSFYRIDYSKLSNLSVRLGWMGIGNLSLLIFLALKNTPLAILTSYSYERIRCLHKIAGYTFTVDMIVHGISYTYYRIHKGEIHKLREHKVSYGILIGFCTMTLVAFTLVRKMKYELFYAVHVFLFLVIVIGAGLHRRKLEHDRTSIAVTLVAAAWFCDRMLRFARLAFYSINNAATVYPLPNGGTRIVLKKSMRRARAGSKSTLFTFCPPPTLFPYIYIGWLAGWLAIAVNPNPSNPPMIEHCYIWLPQIRAFETHPFTIITTDPVELVISKHSGFTKDLHDYAVANPGAELRVSAEGPYGTFPDPAESDKVVLVAGGSGATFTLGLLADMLRGLAPESEKQVDFFWVTRDREKISWFKHHLRDILAHECAHKIVLKLHITSASSEAITTPTVEKPEEEESSSSTSSSSSAPTTPRASPGRIEGPDAKPERDLEAARRASAAELDVDGVCVCVPVVYGRPDIEASVRDAIACVPVDQKVLVAACGPEGLLEAVRTVTARCINVVGPAVELHCEQFGW